MLKLAKAMKTVFGPLAIAVITAALVLSVSGCENEAPPKSSGKYDELILDVNETQVRIERNYLLKNISDGERLYYTQGLELIQSGFLILNVNPRSREAVGMIDRGIALLRNYENLERDQSVIRGLLQRVGGAVVPVADKLGVELSERWIVWNTEFSDNNLTDSGFLMFPGGSWISKIIINGLRQIAIFRSNAFTNYVPHSWLILPAMDLRNLRNPAIRLEHGIKISQAGATPFDQRLFQLKSFKIKISTTYVGAIDKPWEMRDCELIVDEESGELRMQELGEECDWMTYDTNATEMLTNDFYAAFTPVIPLDEYREKNVSIAFVVDQKPLQYDPFSCVEYYSAATCTRKLDEPIDLQKHFVDWELRSFELLGMGQVEFPGDVRQKTLIEHSFAEPRITGHEVLVDPEFNQARPFTPSGRGEDAPPEWVLVDSRPDRPASSGLLSPVYDISAAQDLKFGMRETIRFDFEDEALRTLVPYQVLYSYDYEGGDVLDATWNLVVRSKTADRFRVQNWNGNTISGVAIDPTQTGRVTFLFWYKSDLDMRWQVINYNVKGVGDGVEAIDYTATPTISGPWIDILTEGSAESATEGVR
jgi:hypothetical protein